MIPFTVPPLRDRAQDIPQLADHFLREYSVAYGRKPKELSEDALEALMQYPWPGNVRELRNLMERLVDSCIRSGGLKRAIWAWDNGRPACGSEVRGLWKFA